MDYYSIFINQIIAENKKKDEELRILREKMECFSEMQKNLEIVGRQNKRLKKDNERYREILDRNPTKQAQPPQEG